MTSLLAPLLLGAVIEVAAGSPLPAALARAQPGDVVRLGPGLHEASLGRLTALRVEGAGMDRTRVVAPEGQDGAVIAAGRVELAGLTLEVGPARSALKLLGGEALLADVALRGGAVGAFVEDGRLVGDGLLIRSDFGLLQSGGEATLRRATVLPSAGGKAGLALLRGRLAVAASTVTGPFGEAAVTLSGGEALLDDVVVRAPGPTGVAVTRGALAAANAEIAGARELPASGRVRAEGLDGILGDCVQVRKGTVRLAWGSLARCEGTALTAAGGEVRLDGNDLHGGSAGALVLLDGARAELHGNWVARRGPGLVVMGGATADAASNRWRVDPVFWVECGSGARVRLGFGEKAKEPCAPSP